MKQLRCDPPHIPLFRFVDLLFLLSNRRCCNLYIEIFIVSFLFFCSTYLSSSFRLFGGAVNLDVFENCDSRQFCAKFVLDENKDSGSVGVSYFKVLAYPLRRFRI